VLGGHRFDAGGNIVEIPPSEVHAIWRQSKAAHPTEFSRLRSSRIEWHRRFTQSSEDRGDYQSALFHLDKWIKLAPSEVELIARRQRIQTLLQKTQSSGKQ